jgi:hypothetical protein
MNMVTNRIITVISLMIFAVAVLGCGEIGPKGSRTQTIKNSKAVTFKIPDTGQVRCYDDVGSEINCPVAGESYFGQDANYISNPPSYVDNGDGTKTDVNTGLTWYLSSSRDTWEQALQFCDTLTVAGHSDWRLPSTKELIYTADYDFNYSIYYWASTPNDYNHDYAWVVSLPSGPVFTRPVTDYYDIQCVRGEHYSGRSFIDNGDETVTDSNTDLMWQQPFICEHSFEHALSYCENLDLAGYDDWRLPNIKELVSIVDYDEHWPSIDTSYFPNTNTMHYWSSTTDTLSPDYIWHVKFDTGRIVSRLKTSTGSKYARCVRTVQ